jgi:hypothetical protein
VLTMLQHETDELIRSSQVVCTERRTRMEQPKGESEAEAWCLDDSKNSPKARGAVPRYDPISRSILCFPGASEDGVRARIGARWCMRKKVACRSLEVLAGR